MLEKLDNLRSLNDVAVIKHSLKNNSRRKTTKSSKKGSQLTGIILPPEEKKLKASNFYESGLDNDRTIHSYQSVFGYIRELLAEGHLKNVSATELKEFIKTLEVDLKESVKGNKQEFMKVTLQNMVLFSVHNFCYTRALDLLKEADSRVFSIFKVLHDVLNGYLRDFFRKFTLILENILSIDEKLKGIETASKNLEKEAIDHTSDILNKAETLLSENQKLISQLDENKLNWEAEKKKFQKTIKELEQENYGLLEKMVKTTKCNKSR